MDKKDETFRAIRSTLDVVEYLYARNGVVEKDGFHVRVFINNIIRMLNELLGMLEGG